MADPTVARNLSLQVPQVVHAIGACAFAVTAAWAWYWARNLQRRRSADPHVAFITRFAGVLLLLGLALALPAILRPGRGGRRDLLEAARSAAVLTCGLMATLIAGARRDAAAVATLEARVRELEGDLGGLVSAVGDARKTADSLRGRAEASSTADASTGLASRKLFDDVIGRELKRAKRHERSLALIIAEVDFLEKYSTSFGPQSGEALMVSIANVFKGQVRDTDLLVRFAPHRFAVLMPETDVEKAMEVGDWIRSMISNSPFPHRAEMPGGKVSISLGVGAFPKPLQDPATFQSLVEAALGVAASEKNRLRVAQ
ncbi:MAG: diguanylate cyclase [Planctomycetes bacterium]|nr:diguanylate cyclase [Planctomycetota bacterium]